MKQLVLFFTFICISLASAQTEKTIVTLSDNFTSIEKEYISSRTITFGMIGDYYPFSFKEDGKITGFSYDFINLIIKKSGLKINIEIDNWSNTLTKFKTKEIDLIDVISYNKERELFTNFSQVYFEIPNVIFARKGDFNNYEGLESLKNKKVGITKDIYYYKTLKDLNLFELVEFKNSKDKMKSLAYGKVDAIFNNLISGQKYIKRGAYSNIKVLDELDSTIVKKEDLRLGVKKEDKVLFSIINKSMKSITIEEKEKIYNKWFGTNIQTKRVKYTLKLTNNEKEYLKEKKHIKMCIDPNWMPFEQFDKNGNHIGMTADYYNIFKKHLNIDIKVIKTETWIESLSGIQSRKCDILSLAMETPARKKYLNFTSPYIKIPLVIATKLDVPFIDNIEAIKDKRIGITKGYAFVELLRNKYKNLNIVEVDNIDEGLKKVNQGKLFGYIGTLATISYQFQQGLSGELKIAGKMGENWELGIGVRQDDTILLNILEKVVKSLDAQKQQQILNNWISIKYENHLDYTLIWQILIVVTILFLLFIYREYILKKSNARLQKIVFEKTQDLQKLNDNLELRIKKEVEKNFHIQEKLFKSEKLASMGEMIGNIAHQWRQPLSVISTGATGMRVHKELGVLKDDEFYKICDAVNDNAQYLSKTIDDFTNFIKGDRVKMVFSLERSIHSFLSLVNGFVVSSNIPVVLDLDKSIKLFGYENELIQCLINIFNNSQDALLENNKKEKLIFISTKQNDEKILIKIKDNAGGIQEDVISRIFEPYFTTKHKSQGTGLGLHMAYNLIVDGMNGTIEAKNVNYKYNEKRYLGAEFIITLPIN